MAEEVTLSTAVSTKLTWRTMAVKAARYSRHNISVLKTDILDLTAVSRLHLATQSHSLQELLLPTLLNPKQAHHSHAATPDFISVCVTGVYLVCLKLKAQLWGVFLHSNGEEDMGQ